MRWDKRPRRVWHAMPAVASRARSSRCRSNSVCWCWCLAWLVLALFFALGSAATRGAVADFAGHYEGAWTNITFGSTGKAVIDIQIAGATATIGTVCRKIAYG